MERVLEGDEKNLFLFKALLNQSFSVDDCCRMLRLEGEERKAFFGRNNLSENKSGTELSEEISRAIIKLSEKNRGDARMEKAGNMKFINSHETNRKVFADTMNFIGEETELLKAVENTINNQFVWRDDSPYPKTYDQKMLCLSTDLPETFTTKSRTFEAAEKYAKAGKKVAVLNFANNHYVGGGVVNGANAQEESLCRCSTLYSCISDEKMMKDFYEYHTELFNQNNLNFLANDDLIYSPDVVVCKTDTPVPERMAQNDWYKVDVITCAAPNIGHIPYDSPEEKEELRDLFTKRFKHIIDSAVFNGVEVLILGAFGCGAFGNDPAIVALAAKEALPYRKGKLETVEFAVFATPRDQRNYDEFVKVFGERYWGEI